MNSNYDYIRDLVDRYKRVSEGKKAAERELERLKKLLTPLLEDTPDHRLAGSNCALRLGYTTRSAVDVKALRELVSPAVLQQVTRESRYPTIRAVLLDEEAVEAALEFYDE